MDSNLGKRKGPGEDRNGQPYGYGYGNGYGSPYSYGYRGYGAYGYGGDAGSSRAVEKTIQDYLLILRERCWYIILAFALVLALTAAYAYTRTPLFQSTASVEIFRRTPTVMQMQPVLDNPIDSAEDLNTQVNILKSESIIDAVASRITGEDAVSFMAPYRHSGRPMTIRGILSRNRDVIPERLSLIVSIEYRHPNREMAAKVANLFADAYIEYNAHLRVDESMKAVEELRQRADEQRKKVDSIAAALQAYREKNHLVSLDQRKDIVTDSLKDVNKLVTDTDAMLQSAEIRWKQVQDTLRAGDSLLTLPFIASSPAVAQLQTDVANEKIAVAQLSQRYRAKYPAMIREMHALDEAQTQLNKALQTSAAQVDADYQIALQDYSQAEAARVKEEAASLNLDRYGLEYSNLERDFDVNEKILEQILDLERVRQTASTSTQTIENQNARILDRATPAPRPYFPNYSLFLGLGGLGGLVFGLVLAFSVAYIDDRIRSAFDIETVVGLPILGIIPEVKRMGDPERMEQSLEQRSDREVTEAFSTLMTALQLKEESKNAQCILITSTIASEGKSFIASHLAQTLAAHGEKVVIIDCDLRRPAVNRVFHIENLKGVIDVVSGEMPLDDVICREVKPNLDVIVSGGRSKNPTQMLSSKEFAVMISSLRKSYTRLIIDTPPIAIVSDALIALPLVDGSIYSIYFNKVRRKAAQFCVQRLLESNIPCFGAVLNGLTGGVGGYYYAHYYDRSYKDYYIKRGEIAAGAGAKIVEPKTRRAGR